MFFERFGVQQSECQRLLDEANVDTPSVILNARDLRIIQNDELIGMLNTNEPPAIKFVSTRINGIVALATQLQPHSDTEQQKTTLAALYLLTSGTPAVAKAVLSDPACFVEMLCKPLMNLTLATLPGADAIGNAGGFLCNALDSESFETVFEQRTSATGAFEWLPMHLCMILSASLRATATNPATLVSDSLRYVQLSTSGARSAMQEHISNHLQSHGAEIGGAAAQALGISKHSHTLACEMFSLSSTVMNSFGATFHRRVADLWASSDARSLLEGCVKISTFASVLETVAPLYAPGGKEGEHFRFLVQGLFVSEAALNFMFDKCFTDFVAAPTSMRVNVVRFLNTVLLQNAKWRDRWQADVYRTVCVRIANLSKADAFGRALRLDGVRRDDQLRAVELCSIAVQCFARWTTLQSAQPSALQPDFDELRGLLPTSSAFDSLHGVSLASPHCGFLHCVVEKTVFAAAALIGTAALSQSATHINVQAVASSLLLDEMRAHVMARAVYSALPGHAIMLTFAILDVVEEHAFPDDPDVAAFKTFVTESVFPTVLAAAPSEGVTPSAKDALKWYCMPSFRGGESAASSLGVSGSFGASSTQGRATRVVVDEVDLETIKRQAAAVSFEHNVSEPQPASTNSRVVPLPLAGSNDSTSPSATATTASFESGASVMSSGSPRFDDMAKSSSKKFSIKRKSGTSTSLVASPSGCSHPLHEGDHENPLSLTSSLNESVHSSMDPRSVRSSFEVGSHDDDNNNNNTGTRFLSGPRAEGYRVSPPRNLRPRNDTQAQPDLFSETQAPPALPPSNVNLFAGWAD